jgi:hypothetical protein
LTAELDRSEEIVDAYATSARVIALYLREFCDGSLPYAEMIAEAAKKADERIQQLTKERNIANEELKLYGYEIDRLNGENSVLRKERDVAIKDIEFILSEDCYDATCVCTLCQNSDGNKCKLGICKPKWRGVEDTK